MVNAYIVCDFGSGYSMTFRSPELRERTEGVLLTNSVTKRMWNIFNRTAAN